MEHHNQVSQNPEAKTDELFDRLVDMMIRIDEIRKTYAGEKVEGGAVK